MNDKWVETYTNYSKGCDKCGYYLATDYCYKELGWIRISNEYCQCKGTKKWIKKVVNEPYWVGKAYE